MFHHIVLMEFTAAADGPFFNKVEEYCERIRHTAPQLQRYVFGRNVASRSDGLSHAIIASFTASADHDVYQASDVHQEMKSFMIPHIARIVVCDFDEDHP